MDDRQVVLGWRLCIRLALGAVLGDRISDMVTSAPILAECHPQPACIPVSSLHGVSAGSLEPRPGELSVVRPA